MQRRRVMLAAGKKPRLPREYQEVEFLQASGAERIDTGIPLSNISRIVATFKSINNFSNVAAIVGNLTASGGKRYMPCGVYNDPTNPQYKGAAAIFDGTWSFSQVDAFSDFVMCDAYCAVGTNFSATYNGVHVTGAKVPSISGGTLLLFSLGSYWNNASMLKTVTVYSTNNNRIGLNVPCYRKTDSKPGMYDLAGSICPLTNSPFYINAGTGEFLVGPDVN